MNKRNFEIFGWKEFKLKFEHVILFIIFLIVLFLIVVYFIKDSKNEIEKVIQQRINETKELASQVPKPLVQENKTTINETKEAIELTEYEVLNWDTSSFDSICKQEYGKYRDDVNDINSQIDELTPSLKETKKKLNELEYKSNDLNLQLEKRTSQLKNTVKECKVQ